MTPSALLPATLAVTVNSVVTLALTISNPSDAPLDITFGSGQQFDFTITDATLALVWQWSAGMAFAQFLSTHTVAAHASLVYTAQWMPTVKGTLHATGQLVGVSHHATASASLVIR